MSAGAGGPRAGDYAREIERQWSRILDRPVVLSPKDWALISDWHAREIPLSLILESIRYLAQTPVRRAPRSLAYLAPAVEEAWGVVVEGRRPRGPRLLQHTADGVTLWRQRLETETGASPLGGLLLELLGARDAGEPADALDRRLDEQLPSAVSDDLLSTTRQRVDAELAPFRDRMDASTFDQTRRAAIVDRLRRALGLPYLDRD